MALPLWTKLPKRGRRPQPEKKTPFREEWPMVLDNAVSTRRGKTKDAACLKETLAFITCLKDNNNMQELCKTQGEAVQNCYHNYLAYKEELRNRKKKVTDFVPGISAKDMDPVQLNRFLSHFPHAFKKK
ncbi:CHCH domain-containing protein [Nephila pilipes]|uniref:CHCH domain-containing protein n=1 Tax=Nephila pilipes TaxID=299642 RepID=A0A8X6N2H2_NEPPI|nr:CHCH domain-containing protein [Nephila pilipes]